MFVPEQWPGGMFDLILLSEVVYYLSRGGRRPPSHERNAFLGSSRLCDLGPLDGLDGLSPKWRRGRLLSSSNDWDRPASSSALIDTLNFGWTSCPAPDALAEKGLSERRAIAICPGNSAGLSK